MEIKSVALLGAGAVGSYIIWGLSKLPDIRFGIIAEGSRAARLRDEGCSINNVTYHPQVLSPQEAKGVDLLIGRLKIWRSARRTGKHPRGSRPQYYCHEPDERCGQRGDYCRRCRQQTDFACID